MNDTPTSDPITLEPLGPGPEYRNLHVWLPQLFLETTRSGSLVIENRTFTRCIIEGPAVLLPLEGCNFDGCNLGDTRGDSQTLVLKPRSPQSVTGPIPLRNCSFINCDFVGVGFTGTERFQDEMIAALNGTAQ